MRTIIVETDEVISSLYKKYGPLLKKADEGWFLPGKSTPFLKRGVHYKLVPVAEMEGRVELKETNHHSVYKYVPEPSLSDGVKLVKVDTCDRNLTVIDLPLGPDGYPSLSTLIKGDGKYFVFTSTDQFVGLWDPYNTKYLDMTPSTPIAALELIEAMIYDTVCRISKVTRVSRHLRDFHQSFDYDAVEKELCEGSSNYFAYAELPDKHKITTKTIEVAISNLVDSIFTEYDNFFLPLIHFLAEQQNSTYRLRRQGTTLILTEGATPRDEHWQNWQEAGITEQVLQFAQKLLDNKNSEINIRLY